jgi:hypothetical protein
VNASNTADVAWSKAKSLEPLGICYRIKYPSPNPALPHPSRVPLLGDKRAVAVAGIVPGMSDSAQSYFHPMKIDPSECAVDDTKVQRRQRRVVCF